MKKTAASFFLFLKIDDIRKPPEVRNQDTAIDFVQLICPVNELERRREESPRAEFLKLRSVELFRQLRANGAEAFPDLPPGLALDTAALSPMESAQAICTSLRLPVIAE